MPNHGSLPRRLIALLGHCAPHQTWRTQGKRGIWLRVGKERSTLIPVAVELGFDFHHADPVGAVAATARGVGDLRAATVVQP